MKKTGITTDCVCDLPEEYLRALDVGTIYFYITTDTGRFRDGYVITSGNLLEYLAEGRPIALTNAPEPEEYKAFFEDRLSHCDELVHITISQHVSVSYQNATRALELMGENAKRVTVIDSQNLSTGIAHMVIRAAKLRDEGRSAAGIARAVEAMREKVSTSFITENAEYLYRNGRVSKGVAQLIRLLRVHPVLAMKNGRLVVKTVRLGNYENSVMRYIRGELRLGGRIDKTRLFITHAGCTVKRAAEIRAEAERQCAFDEVIVTKASATVSGNCGPGTVGIIFVNR